MKKLFTLLVFTFAMILGTQGVQAQNSTKVYEGPEAEAKAKVSSLNDEVSLTGDQQTYLFRALVARNYNYNKHLKGKDVNSADYKAKKAEYDKNLDDTAKKHLNAQQYAKFQEMIMKK